MVKTVVELVPLSGTLVIMIVSICILFRKPFSCTASCSVFVAVVVFRVFRIYITIYNFFSINIFTEKTSNSLKEIMQSDQ